MDWAKHEEKHHGKRNLVDVNGVTNEMVTVHDSKGNIVHRMVSPIMLEFQNKDVLQIIVGACLLAVPVAFTQETWDLGRLLPLINVFGILCLSLLFLGSFIFYNYYHADFKTHRNHFFLRLFATYSLSFLIVAILLTLIGQTAWSSDLLLTFKRIVIVTFPSSMSAAVADFVK
jgi:uncharacterized membrane protein